MLKIDQLTVRPSAILDLYSLQQGHASREVWPWCTEDVWSLRFYDYYSEKLNNKIDRRTFGSCCWSGCDRYEFEVACIQKQGHSVSCCDSQGGGRHSVTQHVDRILQTTSSCRVNQGELQQNAPCVNPCVKKLSNIMLEVCFTLSCSDLPD